MIHDMGCLQALANIIINIFSVVTNFIGNNIQHIVRMLKLRTFKEHVTSPPKII